MMSKSLPVLWCSTSVILGMTERWKISKKRGEGVGETRERRLRLR